MRIRLTKRVVDGAQPGKIDQFWWDTDPRGFGLKVTPAGGKLYVLAYHTKQGRRRRYTLDGSHGSPWTVESARKKARELLGQVVSGADPVGDRRQIRETETVKELADRFMEEHVKARRKPRTQHDYQRLLDSHILPALGHRKMTDVTRADVSRLHHKMAHAPRQANQVLAVMSKMFNLSEAWGLRPDGTNPCRHVERNSENRRERFLSGKEFARLAASLDQAERDGSLLLPKKEGRPAQRTLIPANAVAAVRLLLFTGARLGEILTARWDWVDKKRGVLLLPDSKTGAKTVHLNAPALAVLEGLTRLEGNPYVLPGNRTGQHFVGIHNPWHVIREVAGIPDVRLHDLRHSYASVAVTSGMNLPLIGRLLGHTRAETTQRYAHLADDPVKQASELIGQRLEVAMRPEPPPVQGVPQGKKARRPQKSGMSR
jgi:integrase